MTNLSVARQHACVWMHHKVPYRLCMHFLMEQGHTLPQRRLQELVYEQWLHADLRDVVVQPCVPLYATQQQTCQITGQYIVQVYFNMVVCFNSTSTLHCRLYLLDINPTLYCCNKHISLSPSILLEVYYRTTQKVHITLDRIY